MLECVPGEARYYGFTFCQITAVKYVFLSAWLTARSELIHAKVLHFLKFERKIILSNGPGSH